MAGVAVYAVVLLAVSVISHYVGRGGRAGTLRPDRGPGIRSVATTASEQAWRVAHRVAAPWMLAAAGTGYVMVVAGIAYPIVAAQFGWPTGLGLALVPQVSVPIVGVPLAVGVVRANRAARALG